MGFQRYASFAVLASAIADQDGSLPAEVLQVTPSAHPQKTAHRHSFEYSPKKGMLYVRSRAISSRCNDNFDEFPADEIKVAYRTFVGKPVFVNHHNSDHRRMRGLVVDAALHEDLNPDGSADTWVEVLMEVDAVRFPRLAKAVIEGRIDRTSMGTDVRYSVCTACGNRAETPADYCAHIPKMKGQRLTRTTASGSKESVLIAERCYGLGFFENSLLVEPPADPTAYAYGVDTRGLEGSAVAHLARTASVQAILDEGEHDHLDDITAAEISEAGRLLREADVSGVRAELRRANGQSVVINYTGEGGVGRLVGVLSYEGEVATVAGRNGMHSVPDYNVLSVTVTSYADARQGIEPGQEHARENFWNYPLMFPSGATAKVAASFGYLITLACGDHTRYVGRREGQVKTGQGWRCVTHGETTVAAVDGEGVSYRGLGLDTFSTLTTADVAEAESIVAEAMMCSACNPNAGLPDGLCSAHAHMRKQEHQFPDFSWQSLPETGPVADSVLFPTYSKKSKDDYVAPSETKDPSRYDGVTIRKDDKGYYVHTHRARSKSYPSPEAIPDEKVKFIESTGVRTAHLPDPEKHDPSWSEFEGWIDSEPGTPYPKDWRDLHHHDDDAEYHKFMLEMDASRKVAWVESNGGETYLLDIEGFAEAVVSMEVEGNPLEHNGWWTYEAFLYEMLPERLTGRTDTLADAQGECMAYIDRHGHRLQGEHEKNMVGRTAINETKAPSQVDTMRQEACPVCGDKTSFTGQSCLICGYIEPPARFGDPDLEKAKKVDLRGGDVGGEEAGEPLKCPVCGAKYTSGGEAQAATTMHPKQQQPGSPVGPAMNLGTTSAGKPPWLKDKKKSGDDADEDEDPKAKKDPAGTDGQVQPEEPKDEADQQPEDQTDEQAPEAPEEPQEPAQPEVAVKVGDTCPNCNEGVLEVDPDPQSPDAPVDDPNAISGVEDGAGPDVPPNDMDNPPMPDAEGLPEIDPTDTGGGPEVDPGDEAPADHDHKSVPPADGHDHNDADKQPEDGHDHKTKAEGDKDDDPAEDDEAPAKKGNPFAKKTTRQAAGRTPEGSGVGMSEQPTNPAQQSRNRIIEALRGQQRVIVAQGEQISVLKSAVQDIAKASGLSEHPRFASLMATAADEESKPVAETDEAALKPDAKDDPESIGAAPSSANAEVTPGATTDVQNANVALDAEPFNKLEDVTAPVAGTDTVPKGDAAHVETDVRVSPGTNTPFPNNSGWKSSGLETPDDPQTRLFAALKLARKQVATGVAEGDEHIVAQAIIDDPVMTIAIIERESSTLDKVVSARTAAAQRPAQRRLVPQAAQQVERTMPSLQSEAASQVQSGTGEASPTPDEFGLSWA